MIILDTDEVKEHKNFIFRQAYPNRYFKPLPAIDILEQQFTVSRVVSTELPLLRVEKQNSLKIGETK